ncbi:MAG TPA: DoxX family protein [Flavobacterium sp.]
MEKKNKVIYWVATVWLSLGMASSAIVQLLKMDEEVAAFNRLGYPIYLLTILGVWKIFGIIALLIPKHPILKEWAYAGFFFVASGAAISHIVSGDSITDVVPALLLIILIFVSWYFRPAERRINRNNPTTEIYGN